MPTTKKKPARKKATTKKVGRKGVKAWTAAETATLKKAYKTHSATEIAKMLRRTVSSVKAKARTLGLKKPNWRKTAAKKTPAKRKPTQRRAVTKRAPARKKPAKRKTTKKKTTRRR